MAVEDGIGNTVTRNTSTVTLVLNGGSFASGGNTATATAANGIATFNNLVINAVGNYTLTASDGTLTQTTSENFTVFGQAAALVFVQQPTQTQTGTVISPAVTVAVQDQFGYTVATNSSTVTLKLSSGTFGGGANTATATSVNGVATFNNLVISIAGNYTLTASDGSLAGAISSNFAVFSTPPRVLSVNCETPTGSATEGASVTYAVTFSEPVTGVTSADFLLALTGGLKASSTVTVSPSGGYNSVYQVTVNSLSGKGTVGLNLVDNGSILDQVGDHLPNASGTFQGPKTVATGISPEFVAVADLNGDGKPDLIFIDNKVNVLLGNGDGTFQAKKTYAVGSFPASVTVADVNGDGKPDLIVANEYSNNIGILLGNGDGTFQAQKTFSTGSNSYPRSVAVADLNGDGKLDLVAAVNSGASVLLGNGDGTFQAENTLVAGLGAHAIAVADMNGDGKLDLVVPSYSVNGYVYVLAGNGDGTFQSPKGFITGSSPSSIAVADLNGDGHLDFVTVSALGAAAWVSLGNSGGTFPGYVSYYTDAELSCVTVADVNGDGKLDLEVSSISNNDVDVLLGNGDGTFQRSMGFVAGQQPQYLAVADVNGDGNPDLITVASNNVNVLLANDSFTGQVCTVDQPTKLAFAKAPASTTAGNVINASGGVQVAVQDSANATVTIDSSAVTLTLNGGTFAGGGNTVTATAANGVATFSNLVIDAVGSYTLTASDGTLTSATSGSFTISPASPAELAFAQQPPADGTAGAALSPAVTVTVQDQFGNTVTTNNSTITLTLSGGTFASGGNTVTVNAASGVATFNNLVIDAAGPYTLTASDGMLTGATSGSFTVSPAAAAELAFTGQPGDAMVGRTLGPAVTVTVQDAFGNTVTTDTSSVTISLGSGTFSSGGNTVTVAAVSGVATFSSLAVGATGSYTLAASDGSLAGATSSGFNVWPLGDVNHEGAVDAADIDAVYQHLGQPANSQWKIVDDGNVVGQEDVDYLVQTILHTAYGDANLDCKVDFYDFQQVLYHWCQHGTGWAGGDFNGDGVTDFGDFQFLLDNWNPLGIGLGASEETAIAASSSSIVTAASVVPANVSRDAAPSTVATAPATSELLSSSLVIQAGATLAPAASAVNPWSGNAVIVPASGTTSAGAIYTVTSQTTAASTPSAIIEVPSTLNDTSVDLLTPLITPVVA